MPFLRAKPMRSRGGRPDTLQDWLFVAAVFIAWFSFWGLLLHGSLLLDAILIPYQYDHTARNGGSSLTRKWIEDKCIMKSVHDKKYSCGGKFQQLATITATTPPYRCV